MTIPAEEFHVVVADDSPTDLELACIAARGSALVMHAVDDRDRIATEIESIRSQGVTPRAVFADLNMPGQTIPELATSLAGDPNTAGMALIVMTDSSSDTAREECLRSGADLFLRKPVGFSDFESLMAEIGRALAGPNSGLAALDPQLEKS